MTKLKRSKDPSPISQKLVLLFFSIGPIIIIGYILNLKGFFDSPL